MVAVNTTTGYNEVGAIFCIHTAAVTVYGYFVIRDTALIHVKITTIYVYTGTTTFGNLVFGNFAVIQYQGTQGHYTSSYIILCMGNLADLILTVGDTQRRSFSNLNGIKSCCTGDCFSI